MNEVERIVDQLKRAFEGPAWHGPSLTEVLVDVLAERAAARPIPNAHTIWEIVLHIATWERAVLRMLNGEGVKVTQAEDWPAVADTSESSWRLALGDLRHGHFEMKSAVAALAESRLAERVPGGDFPFYVLLHGVIQHDLYHAGQMQVLKKA